MDNLLAPFEGGHRVALMRGGDELFPAMVQAIEEAHTEVWLATYIFNDDPSGRRVVQALRAASARGVQVRVVVDGFGSNGRVAALRHLLRDSAVGLEVFRSLERWWAWSHPSQLRRMHHKLCAVDGQRAFVGGINFSADHLTEHGPGAKQDYAVEVHGPLVADLRMFLLRQLPTRPRPSLTPPAPAGEMRARLAVRDNHDHPDDIERHYRAAIHAARERVVIANAYFLPGRKLRKALPNSRI